ncbi:tRNA-queuosine alpha-mannosyltransferase domain-containing protein [Marinomonas mediterranea]|uniref:tRNA-queuosine alpha-mannosyltransferase domain-containing protein n=1 Tax=Marinomonas mediterranea TaxID=119864 RepID=UPI00234A8CE8|nr:DUF3524 domain-containing protein [Marinomonas mediterranea]WCN09112.1 DUF3524 domain-containing protein [Marinomonas mediterranea]
MKILLLSAYHAQSHKAWADTLKDMLPEVAWFEATLPPHYFSWRIRGNALGFAFESEFKEIVSRQYDLVIATSMTDVVGLKAFLPQFAMTPWLLYFHENQYDYPASHLQQGLVEMQMVTLYSALAAEACVFNSAYNRDSFLSGVTKLLNKLPDYTGENCPEILRNKSTVISVPLANDVVNQAKALSLSKPNCHLKREHSGHSSTNCVPHIIWAARWEYDKGPDRLLAALRALKNANVEFKLSVLGQSFRDKPAEFDVIEKEFAQELCHFGFLPSRQDYLTVLSEGDVFLSTALHEFQGLSVLEAVALGCLPVLPNRQVYPELFGGAYTYSTDTDIEVEASHVVSHMRSVIGTFEECPVEDLSVESLNEHQSRSTREQQALSVDRFTKASLKPLYQELIQSLFNLNP